MHGRLVLAVMNRIAQTWGDEMQVTENLPLSYLESFCHETLDIRSVREVEKSNILQEQISAFWPMLMDILDLEGEKYKPYYGSASSSNTYQS